VSRGQRLLDLGRVRCARFEARNRRIPGGVFASSSWGTDLEFAVGDLELPITFRISRAA